MPEGICVYNMTEPIGNSDWLHHRLLLDTPLGYTSWIHLLSVPYTGYLYVVLHLYVCIYMCVSMCVCGISYACCPCPSSNRRGDVAQSHRTDGVVCCDSLTGLVHDAQEQLDKLQGHVLHLQVLHMSCIYPPLAGLSYI